MSQISMPPSSSRPALYVRHLMLAVALMSALVVTAAEGGLPAPAAASENPVLVDFKTLPAVQWAHWYKKATLQSDGVQVVADQGGGNLVFMFDHGMDLSAYQEWTPRLTLKVGPNNTTTNFYVILHDGHGNACSYEFLLTNPVPGSVVSLTEREGASLREPSQVESYRQQPQEYANYAKVTLAGRMSNPVDVVFQRLELVPPDKAILKSRAGLHARLAASAEARRKKRLAQQLGFVSSVFANDMILQRGIPLPVWGRGKPGEKITVSFGGHTADVSAAQDGAWRLALPVQQPDAEGKTLTVQGDGRTASFTNVLVGDVWLYSGQSNMQMGLKASRGGDEAVAAANFPLIRFLSPPITRAYEPLEAFDPADVTWRKAEAANAKDLANLSAIGYWTALEIHKAQGIPVGIINLSQGSTNIIAWMSRETVEQVSPELKGRHFPVYFNGNIHPLMPFGVRGIIWYQGEQEGGQGPYAQLLRTMITDWRSRFGLPDLDFGIVQLPDNGAPDATDPPNAKANWGTARDMQRQVLDLPHTGLAVTLGLAEGIDTTVDIHPANKNDFALVVAAMMKGRFYGAAGEYTGPVPVAVRMHAGAVRIQFDHVAGGLATADKSPLRGFGVAGADGKFVWAEATIVSRNEVDITAATVTSPTQVRYAWHRNPTANKSGHGANLANDAGFRAGSFAVPVPGANDGGSSKPGTAK